MSLLFPPAPILYAKHTKKLNLNTVVLEGGDDLGGEDLDMEDEEETEDTTESIDFLTKMDDVYVFAVSSSAIKSDELSLPTTMGIEMSNAIGQSIPRYGSSQIINLLFVKNGQETSLFSSKENSGFNVQRIMCLTIIYNV